jgi:NPCBM/NEW2 domain
MPTLLVAALFMGAQPAPVPPTFVASSAEDDQAGQLLTLKAGFAASLSTPNGPVAIKQLVSLRRTEKPVPAFPVGPLLITAAGDRVAGTVDSGDAKQLAFRCELNENGCTFPLDTLAAVWFVAPPAETPTDPARYTWLAGLPSRDVLLYRNGDVVRGVLGGSGDTAVTFTPDGGAVRTVAFRELAAVGFNPRFARARKPKEAYAQLVLADGTRVHATDVKLTAGVLTGSTFSGQAIAVPTTKLMALTVLQGRAMYLSDLKPKKAETAGFLGDGWAWTADRTVRGQPLRLLQKEGEATFDKGLGTHPKTVLTYDLGGKYSRFDALVGLDADSGKRGRADVRIRVDGKEVSLPALKVLAAGPAIPVRVDLRGAKELVLIVDFGPSGDVHADVNWADARLVE